MRAKMWRSKLQSCFIALVLGWATRLIASMLCWHHACPKTNFHWDSKQSGNQWNWISSYNQRRDQGSTKDLPLSTFANKHNLFHLVWCCSPFVWIFDAKWICEFATDRQSLELVLACIVWALEIFLSMTSEEPLVSCSWPFVGAALWFPFDWKTQSAIF